MGRVNHAIICMVLFFALVPFVQIEKDDTNTFKVISI